MNISDMIAMGIPVLQSNSLCVAGGSLGAGLMITTECMITEIKEDKPAAPAMDPSMGGMITSRPLRRKPSGFPGGGFLCLTQTNDAKKPAKRVFLIELGVCELLRDVSPINGSQNAFRYAGRACRNQHNSMFPRHM